MHTLQAAGVGPKTVVASCKGDVGQYSRPGGIAQWERSEVLRVAAPALCACTPAPLYKVGSTGSTGSTGQNRTRKHGAHAHGAAPYWGAHSCCHMLAASHASHACMLPHAVQVVFQVVNSRKEPYAPLANDLVRLVSEVCTARLYRPRVLLHAVCCRARLPPAVPAMRTRAAGKRRTQSRSWCLHPIPRAPHPHLPHVP